MKVSVLMPTYNHSVTIAQAIESFLVQKCSFDIQLLISDDASTDSTLSIARRYEAEYSDKIVVISKPENEGLIANYKTLVSRADGEYLAVLESDDYWIDPLKLQKQVDFLDAHKEYGLSFSRVEFLSDDGILTQSADQSRLISDLDGRLYEYSLLRSIIFSPTVVFRRSLYDSYCNIDDYISLGFKTFDYPVWLSILAHSKVHYLSDATAVYRVQSSSISNTGNLRKRLDFEKSVAECRSYVTAKYGTGNIWLAKIKAREALLLCRIIWRYLFR